MWREGIFYASPNFSLTFSFRKLHYIVLSSKVSIPPPSFYQPSLQWKDFVFSHQLSQRLLQSSFTLSCWALRSHSLLFSFFFFSPIQSKGDRFCSWSLKIPSCWIRELMPLINSSLILKHHKWKKKKAGEVQSWILDLLPDLKEVGKDNSVLFYCREPWFLLWWLMTSSLCTELNYSDKFCLVPSARPWYRSSSLWRYGELGGLQALKRTMLISSVWRITIMSSASNRLKCWEYRCAIMSSIKQNYSMLR